VTKQSGYATKQTGYFWTKQLGLNNYLKQQKTSGPVKIYAQNCLQAPAE